MKKFISEYSDGITVILIIIAVLLTIGLLIWGIDYKSKTLSTDIYSLIGTTASLFGFIIAIIQIIALQAISVLTQNTITATKEKLILGLSISDVTEGIKLVSEIDSFIGSKKYEIARLKIIDLREKLIQFKNSSDFKDIFPLEDVERTIVYLNFEISQLYLVVFSEVETEFDSTTISEKLQDISTHFTGFKNQIKYQTI